MNKTTEALKLLTVALKDIACTSQTDDLLWWQIRAREALAAIREALSEQDKQEPVGVVKVLKMYTDSSIFHYVDCQHLPEGTRLYAAPVSAKAIRAEERQRCIEAIRKAHHKELCDVWDCIEVIKELE